MACVVAGSRGPWRIGREGGVSVADESLKGKLLVATPALGDPNFFGTVVLLLDHSERGALGVVLNRPSDVAVEATLAPWAGVTSAPRVGFIGGPVSREAALALVDLAEAEMDAEEGEGWRPIVAQVGMVDLRGDPGSLDSRVRGVRVFSGHAGWAGGQLESELNSGAWMVAESEPGDVVTAVPSGLWYQAIKRLGGGTQPWTFPN